VNQDWEAGVKSIYCVYNSRKLRRTIFMEILLRGKDCLWESFVAQDLSFSLAEHALL
jgi:hypothetical protein